MLRSKVACAIMALVVAAPTVRAEDCTGKVRAEWLEDGRNMVLLEDYRYIDPPNATWLAPKGVEIDGASIPQFAWSSIGGPFEGKYRKASVSHDAACDVKDRKRTWEATHQMFYDHMICSGVETWKAKAMYWAVYNCGPRWGPGADDWRLCNAEEWESSLARVAGRLKATPEVSLESLRNLKPRTVRYLDYAPIANLREPATSNVDFEVTAKR